MLLNNQLIQRNEIEIKNPYNNEVIGYVTKATLEEVKQAYKFAKEYKKVVGKIINAKCNKQENFDRLHITK